MPLMANLGAQRNAMPPQERAVFLENHLALMRRWKLARDDGETLHPRVQARLFPGQRDLLELLSVSTKEEVEQMAKCQVPLFTLDIITSFQDIVIGRIDLPTEPIEAESHQETLLALSARLDAIRMSPEQASMMYHLSRKQVQTLSSFCSPELQYLALQPTSALRPLVRLEFFLSAAFGRPEWRTAERTALAAVQRSNAVRQ